MTDLKLGDFLQKELKPKLNFSIFSSSPNHIIRSKLTNTSDIKNVVKIKKKSFIESTQQPKNNSSSVIKVKPMSGNYK